MFAGRTVVITGAGRGLGYGIAHSFGQAGAHSVIAEIDAPAGARAAEALRDKGLSATFEVLDVCVPEQSLALVDKIVRERGSLDVWVNNAGVSYQGPAETLALKDWDESLSVMLSGAFYCSQAVGRHMLARGRGVIVNVASVNGYQALEGQVADTTAKAGLIMLTQALGVEWARRGVRVVGVAPGMVMTEPAKKGSAVGTATMAAHERRTPMRRLGTIEEIAEAVLFLASDEAAYITAECLRVDGGWLAYQLF